MFPVLRIGPIAIQTSGLVILVGLWFATGAAERAAARRGLPADALITAVTAGLLSGVIGARLAFVLRYLPVYLERPLDALSPSLTALDPIGGALVGVVVAALILQRYPLPWLRVLDSLAAGLAVFGLATALSHVASGAAYGSPTNLPWGISLWGTDRHPTQVLETLAALAVMVFILRRRDEQPGQAFAVWLALASGSRLVIEGLRGDSALGPGGIRLSQVAALCFTLCGLWLYGRLARRGSDQVLGEQVES